MINRIICSENEKIVIIDNGKTQKLTSEFINQYCSNHAQIVKKHSWKTEGYGAQFRHEQSSLTNEHIDSLHAMARITGISSNGHDEIIYSVTVGDTSGVFRRSIAVEGIDNEGHILHDRQLKIFDIASNSDGRIAFSVINKNGEQNIAICKKGTSQYNEITEGISIDRNPCWDPGDPDILLFDSAPAGFYSSGQRVVYSRSIMKINLVTSELEELFANDNYDLVNPQIDDAGNIWCIRRPYKPVRNAMSLLEIFLIPYRLGVAIFRAIEFFTIKNTGKPLITSGPNPAKSQSVPEDMMYDNIRIEAQKNYKENLKYDNQFAGYIPGSWELISISKDKNITVKAKGVCTYRVISHDRFIYSNGNYLFDVTDNKKVKVSDIHFPASIIVI
ncbi:MAG: hypothetical protein GX639_09760 [Fibrobacter sp.]|nr:hypothetical protein [Fibrobacter sp.]